MPNVLPDNPSILGHIFRAAEGHLEESAASRELLIRIANDATRFRAMDRYSNEWYAELNADGTQVWAEARDGIIVNGGMNQVPVSYHIRTGFKRP